MYRSLLLQLNKSPRLNKNLYCYPLARTFSNKESDGKSKETPKAKEALKENETPKAKIISKVKEGSEISKSKETTKVNERKSAQFSKIVKLKSIVDTSNKSSLQTRQRDLMDKAQAFNSIGPKDKESISQTIGKPKMFVRKTARNQSEFVKHEANEDELVQTIARGLDKRLVDAARRVASKMPKHIAKETERELLDSIKKHKQDTLTAKKRFESDREFQEDVTKSLSYQIIQERSQHKSRVSFEYKREKVEVDLLDDLSATSNSHSITKPKSPGVTKSGSRIGKSSGLFSGERLNIFDPKGLYLTSDLIQNSLWEKLQQEELESSTDLPPENAFEEMTKWTKEGKLWQFPINNEQGLYGDDTPFYEHVLLDNLLEGFPDKGPIRQFMELVVLGLSRNPYISVERKHETVAFYKEFFEKKNLFELVTVSEAPAE